MPGVFYFSKRGLIPDMCRTRPPRFRFVQKQIFLSRLACGKTPSPREGQTAGLAQLLANVTQERSRSVAFAAAEALVFDCAQTAMLP